MTYLVFNVTRGKSGKLYTAYYMNDDFDTCRQVFDEINTKPNLVWAELYQVTENNGLKKRLTGKGLAYQNSSPPICRHGIDMRKGVIGCTGAEGSWCGYCRAENS